MCQVKKTLDWINRRLDTAEENSSKMKDRKIQFIQMKYRQEENIHILRAVLCLFHALSECWPKKAQNRALICLTR